MRIVILGGYGVFGSRLAELLVRDGHEVVISGRDEASLADLAQRLNCQYRVLDHRRDPAAIFAIAPEVVVDAAGPFQGYGVDPYVIPRLCLEHGVDYLDLSDDAAFTQGISQLDAQARSSQRRLLSGVSSVPGISSVVAAELCDGLDEVLLIDCAILPGNRAPRGTSVIASIVGQLGTASQVWRGGQWRSQPCWGDACRIELAPDLIRSARFIEVPDIRLFPAFFRARSVIFRAGLELGVLNQAMVLVAALRRRWPFAITPKVANAVRWMANLLLPFGTDRGGMRVRVVGRSGEQTLRREWRLIAEQGDGPYIPTVMARTLLRNLQRVPPGARACLAEASRAEVEAAMADLAISFAQDETPQPALIQAALAEQWQQLPPAVQAIHDVQDIEQFSGTAQVTRGGSLIARLAGGLSGFPPAAERVALTVSKTRSEAGEVWQRNFAGRVMRSQVTPAAGGRIRERFGPFTYELDLLVEDGCLRFQVRRGWLLGVPLPRFMLAASDSREYVEDGILHFDVTLGAPLGGGLMVRYRGQLRPDAGMCAEHAVPAGTADAMP